MVAIATVIGLVGHSDLCKFCISPMDQIFRPSDLPATSMVTFTELTMYFPMQTGREQSMARSIWEETKSTKQTMLKAIF